MTRELLVLRHGKSDWATGRRDFDRPLAPRGRKASRRIGRLLAEHGMLPDIVLSSSALRARQTAERVCRFAGVEAARIEWEPAIYEAELDTLLELLSRVPEQAARVMIVGHNPGFDELVRYLGGDTVAEWDAPNLMPTAALAHLEMPESWDGLRRGAARCRSLVRPRELDQGAPGGGRRG